MKNIYWQQHNIPRYIIVAFCIFVLLGLFVVEREKQEKYQPNYQEKLQAATLTAKAFKEIRQLRLEKKIPIIPALDPQSSGLVGKQLTEITSDSSQLSTKQMTVNPNITALFIDWLKQAKLEKGDVVALNMTGSFPALDIAMLSAIKTLQLKPLITFSAAASQYGANIPNFSWLDMYHYLVEKKIFSFPVLGVSLGGPRDSAYGMKPEGVAILKATIKKYNYPFIASTGTIDAINKRMQLFKNASVGTPISAYINVGGNMASIGLKRLNETQNVSKQKKLRSIETGVVDKMPIYLANTDSVAVRFLKQGIPLVNVHKIGKVFTQDYHFPEKPTAPIIVGTGSLFYQLEYDTWLAVLILALDVIAFIVIAWISKKYVIRYKR